MKPAIRMSYLATLAFLLLPLLGEAKETREVFAGAKHSVVLIISYDRNNIPLSMGSGFYVKKNTLLTNYHVLEGGRSFACKLIGQDKRFKGTRITHFSKSLDLALLEVDLEGVPIPIAKDGTAQVGDKVVAIGNPKGLEGTVSEGIVSGLRPVEQFNIFQITAPISPGSSGGPVLNTQGEVLGVATFTIADAQNLNFAVPASLFTELERRKRQWEPETKGQITPRTGTAGIELALYRKESTDLYEVYSIRNTTTRPIKNLVGVFLYRDMNGKIIHFRLVQVPSIIPAGLAEMRKDSAQRVLGQTFGYHKNAKSYNSRDELYDIELRVLAYEIVEHDSQPDIFDVMQR